MEAVLCLTEKDLSINKYIHVQSKPKQIYFSENLQVEKILVLVERATGSKILRSNEKREENHQQEKKNNLIKVVEGRNH